MRFNISLTPAVAVVGPSADTMDDVMTSVNNGDSSSSSIIWVILFSLVIFMSIISNTIYILTLILGRCISFRHVLLISIFLVNILEYGLLGFEFSLGQDNQFTFSDTSCSIYQFFIQLSPLLSSSLLVIYILSYQDTKQKISTPLTIIFTMLLVMMLLIPSLMFSEIAVYPSGARYCVIDMSSLGDMVGMDIASQHIITAIYAIVYRAVLAFWLPALIIILPVINMFKMINTEEDKNLSISLSIAIAISYIVSNLPLATVTTVRQAFLIQSAPMAYKEKYLLDVMESLLKLLSFFFHVFRPLVCLVLKHGASFSDQDLILNEKLRCEEKRLLKRDEEDS